MQYILHGHLGVGRVPVEVQCFGFLQEEAPPAVFPCCFLLTRTRGHINGHTFLLDLDTVKILKVSFCLDYISNHLAKNRFQVRNFLARNSKDKITKRKHVKHKGQFGIYGTHYTNTANGMHIFFSLHLFITL